MDHVVSANLNINQVNDDIDYVLKFDCYHFLYSLDYNSNYIKDPPTVVAFYLKKVKKAHTMYASGMTFLQDDGDSDSMVKIKHIKH